ncbi:MAG: DUF4166 domain-containing protein [Pikeienuella sp.]
MKILIAGGYGVFGGRLARLLMRDGHDIIIAGRNLKHARRFCDEFGGTPMRLDMRGDLASLRRARPEIVVDAAGPFQAYGDDPYKLARQAIAIGAHYFDLSDDADFAVGIATLDGTAKAANVVALSAASSAPAISAAASRALAHGMDTIALVDIAILPGNRAPRGYSVMQAIMGQAGKHLRLWRNGTWQSATNWSSPRRYELGNGTVRTGYLIRVPDVEILPDALNAQSVLFRAGMELPVMNHALSFLAWLQKKGLTVATPWVISLARRIADLLKPFGTDTGGMVVTVTGLARGRKVARRWTLTAEAGDGPFIPATPIRALVQHLPNLPSGARACADDLSLKMLAENISDISVKTEISEIEDFSVFERALAAEWSTLSAPLQQAHDVPDMLVLSGQAQVTRGQGVIPAIAARLFGFPPESPATPVMVTMERRGQDEIWERNFDGNTFRSTLSPAGTGRFRERFGPFTFELTLRAGDDRITMAVDRGWLGPLPLPRALLPGGDGVETCKNGRFTFDVTMRAPLTGALIVRYHGWLLPEEGRSHTP